MMSRHSLSGGTLITDLQLADRIDAFIQDHAKLSAAYDPDHDEPSERFNGPDSAMFEAAAEALKTGRQPDAVRSSFGSGCYKGWPLYGVEAEHDELRRLVNERLYEVTVAARPSVP